MEERLTALKKALSLEWGELADALGISRSMLDHARKGLRRFGPKTIRVLYELEARAGLSKSPMSVGNMYDPRENASGNSIVKESTLGILRMADAFERHVLDQFSQLHDDLKSISDRLTALEKKGKK